MLLRFPLGGTLLIKNWFQNAMVDRNHHQKNHHCLAINLYGWNDQTVQKALVQQWVLFLSKYDRIDLLHPVLGNKNALYVSLESKNKTAF